MSNDFKAFLTRDKKELVMMSGDWRLRCPASDLQMWLKFHQDMWGRKAKNPGEPGPYAEHYEDAVRVLGDLLKKLEAEQCAS